MTAIEAQTLTLKRVINSNIDAKYFSDYAVVTAVYGDPVSTVDVTHFAPAYYDDGNNPVLSISKDVEVLYTATAGVSVEIPVAVGDTVLLVGSHSLVAQLSTVKDAPQKPGEGVAYTKETLKAIPVGVLDSSAGVYLRFKDGKVQLKNATKSLFTVLDNFEQALKTFCDPSNAQTAAVNTACTSLGIPMVALLSTLYASVTVAKADLAQIMEA